MPPETKKVSVAQFLTTTLATCGKAQKDVAQEMGYENPNIITMFKQGLTKVPLGKVGNLAKALDVDPVFLFRLVMQEYSPETLIAIEEIFESSILTGNERELIAAYRKATHGTDASAVIADAKDVIAFVMV